MSHSKKHVRKVHFSFVCYFEHVHAMPKNNLPPAKKQKNAMFWLQGWQIGVN